MHADAPAARPYHHGDLAVALVRAAADLLERDGVGEVSLRRVAREAGVSHAAPYRHFRDKHSLLEAVADEGFRDLKARMEEVRRSSFPTPRHRLASACRAYVELVLARPERSHLMFGGLLRPEARSPELRSSAERAFGELVTLVRDARASGALTASIPTGEIVLTLWPATHGLAMLAASGHLVDADLDTSPGRLAERLTDHLLDGVGSRPAADEPGDSR